MNEDKRCPPQWVLKFLAFFCPDHLYEEIEGDLLQRFAKDVKSLGERRANWRFVWNGIRFFRPGIVLRNKFSFELNHPAMFYNYLKTIFRHVLKNKVNFISKLSGLVLAFFCFLIIAIYVSFQSSFDRYHEDYELIYRLNTQRKENGQIEKYGIAPLALGAMLKDRFPEIAAYCRMSFSNVSHVRYDQRIVKCSVFPTDSTLFDVFTFRFIKGSKDALLRNRSIVLTASIAFKLFGKEEPLQKLITINNEKDLYEVTGVVEDLPANSHFRTDAFISMQGDYDFSVNNIISPVNFVDQSAALYIKVYSQADVKHIEERIESLLDEHVSEKDRVENAFSIFLQPLKKVYFDEPLKYEFAKKGNVVYLFIFITLGVFLLLSAIISYVNLSIADFSNRAREIGVRKVMGARRSGIVAQSIFETFVYSLFSLGLSIALLYLLFPKITETLASELRYELLLQREVMVSTILVFITLVICSSAFPAYWFITSSAVSNLKRSLGPDHHSSVGKTLLIVQFMISGICISATLTLSQQLDFIHTKDLGFDRKNLVVLTMPEDFSVDEMRTLKEQLGSVSGVESVSNCSFRIGGGYWKDWYTAEVNGEMKSLELYEVFSDDALFKTLGMELLEGRLFDANLPADSGAAFVINETAVRELGWKDPVGKRIYTHPEESGKWDGTVVGVVTDININSLHEKVRPLVMRLPWQKDYPEYFVYIRLDGATDRTLNAIEKKFREIRPGYPLEYHFVDEFYNNQHEKERKAYASLKIGTLIIMLVSSLGIFSLALYMSNRRMKEFGIRKVLGASFRQITFLHMRYFIRAALIANAVALPVAYWLMKEWLDRFAYRTELNGLAFICVAIISVLLVIISTSYSLLKVESTNPVEVIKME